MKFSIQNLLDFISLDKLRFRFLERPEGRFALQFSMNELEAGREELPGLMIEKLSLLLEAPGGSSGGESFDFKDGLQNTTLKLEDLSILLSEEWLNSPASRKFFKSLGLSLKFDFREGGRIHADGSYKIFPFSGEVVLSVKGPWLLAVRIENLGVGGFIPIPNFLTAFIMNRLRKYLPGDELTLCGQEITIDLEKLIPVKMEGALLEVDVKDRFLYLIAGAA